MEKVAQRMSICQIFNKLYVNVKYCTACGLCRVNVICNESHDIKQNFTIPEFLNNTIMDKRMAFLGKLLVQLPTVTFPILETRVYMFKTLAKLNCSIH